MNIKPKKETIIRTIIAGAAMVNFLLTTFGKNPLPFSEEEMYKFLSTVAMIASEIWVWWKNNSFTRPAIEADKYLEELKDGAVN